MKRKGTGRKREIGTNTALKQMLLSKSEVEALAAARIAPILKVDGGSVEVVSVEPSTRSVTVRFGGAYRGNPCRGVVLEYVVRPILQECFGEISRLEIAD